MKKDKQRLDQVFWGLNRGLTLKKANQKRWSSRQRKKSTEKTRQTPINVSPVESPVCWRGKSPLRTEAIPTSPDRVQQQPSHAKTQVPNCKIPRCDKRPTLIPTLPLFMEKMALPSLAPTDHNSPVRCNQTPARTRRNNKQTSVKPNRCNYVSVREDTTHSMKHEHLSGTIIVVVYY